MASEKGQRPPSLTPEQEAQWIDSTHGAMPIVRSLWRKLARRFRRQPQEIGPAGFFNGILVFDSPELRGGGQYEGPLLYRALMELGFRRCHRAFDFCAGCGYIGFSLLGMGFCERVTLSDVSPKAVAAARMTAVSNGIEHLVNVYRSDALDQIPQSEKWDLVVGLLPSPDYQPSLQDSPLFFDRDWNIRRRFYKSVKKFMNPGGSVVFMEVREYCTAEQFRGAIEEGGGKIVGSPIVRDLRGAETNKFLLISEW